MRACHRIKQRRKKVKTIECKKQTNSSPSSAEFSVRVSSRGGNSSNVCSGSLAPPTTPRLTANGRRGNKNYSLKRNAGILAMRFNDRVDELQLNPLQSRRKEEMLLFQLHPKQLFSSKWPLSVQRRKFQLPNIKKTLITALKRWGRKNKTKYK